MKSSLFFQLPNVNGIVMMPNSNTKLVEVTVEDIHVISDHSLRSLEDNLSVNLYRVQREIQLRKDFPTPLDI